MSEIEMEKQEKNLKNEKTNVKSNRFGQNTTLILIITLFLILSIAVSSYMIYVSSSKSESTKYYTNFQDSTEYTETTMHTLLHSTLPKTTYEDNDGLTSTYIGYSVEHLLIVDSNLRIENDTTLNISNLEEGIEKQIQVFMESSFNNRQDYVLLVQSLNSSNSKDTQLDDYLFVISSLDGKFKIEKLNENPDFQKQLITFEHTKAESEPFELVLKFYYI